MCDCLCVFPKERPKKNHVFCKFVCKNRVMYGCCVRVRVRVLCELSVVWPVRGLLLSVQTICSFSLKPTRSMRVICQVKYCYFLLFHLALLHWGSDCICATSCQRPSGPSYPASVIIRERRVIFCLLKMIQRKKWDCKRSLYVAQNVLRLFGVDLVKMKSLPSVSLLSFRHACNLMLLLCSHICQKYVFMYFYSSWFNAHFILLVTVCF